MTGHIFLVLISSLIPLSAQTLPPIEFTRDPYIDGEFFNNLTEPDGIMVPLPSSDGSFRAFPFYTASDSQSLNSITIDLRAFIGSDTTPGDTYIKIYSGTPTIVGGYIGTLTESPAVPQVYASFEAITPIALQSDSTYWIMIGSTAPNSSYASFMTGSSAHTGIGSIGSTYTVTFDQGQTFSSVQSFPTPEYLKIRIGVVAVPESANYGLLASSTVFLALVLKRKKHQSQDH